MKLIKRTYKEALKWIFPLLIVGSIFSFYVIKYIIYEEADEHLTYEMERLIEYHNKYDDLPDYHKLTNIIEDFKIETPFFKDTFILEPKDGEMIPHRELFFSINHDGTDYAIVLQQILPGNDDILRGTILMVSGLLVLIAIVLFLMISSISAKLWSPFFKTLDILSKYKLSKDIPVFKHTDIDEFNILNETISELLSKIESDFKRTKEFNENASHELQTNLAIIRANAEKLTYSESNHKEIQLILNATQNLSHAQKSLLLLSKIGNLEFSNNSYVNFSEIINNSLTLFEEAISLREIKVTKEMKATSLFIDAGLANILSDNLIKNAIKYNSANGFINIILDHEKLTIENSSSEKYEDTTKLFERFYKGQSGNIGLGLAIVKQICDVYKFSINYTIEKNIHKIEIIFPKI